VAGRLLHVAEGDAGVESSGDEAVAQGVRADSFRDSGAAGDTPDDPGGGMTVESGAMRPRKIGPLVRSPTARSTVRAVRGAIGTRTVLAPLRRTVMVR
jgi:hypothetical protein